VISGNQAWLLKRSPARGPPSRSRGSRCARRGAARTGRSRGSKSTRRTAPYRRGRRAEADAGCEESRRIERRRHRQDVGVHRAERSHPEGDRTYSRLIISRGSSRGIGASRRISAHLGASRIIFAVRGQQQRERSQVPRRSGQRPLREASILARPRPCSTRSTAAAACATACPNLVGEITRDCPRSPEITRDYVRDGLP